MKGMKRVRNIKINNLMNKFICFFLIMVCFSCIIGCNEAHSTQSPTAIPGPMDTPEDELDVGTYDFLTEEEFERINSLYLDSNSKVYSVNDFGDTSGNDCSGVIQSAINWIQDNGGGVLFFPAGRYDIRQPIIFTEGKDAKVVLYGENYENKSSQIVIYSRLPGDAITVKSSNISIANISFSTSSKDASALNILGDKTTIYKCNFSGTYNKYSASFIKISGTNGLFYDLKVTSPNNQNYVFNFTKQPGYVCKGNKMFDTYIGGTLNGVLVDSIDENGCPEDVYMSRMTFLNYSGGQIDIKSVKGCTITNSMLDQALEYCLRLDPQGMGIDGVEISKNYIAAAFGYDDISFERHNIWVIDNDCSAQAKNILIEDNSFWASRYSIYVENENVSSFIISRNLVAGHQGSLYMKKCKDTSITSNVFKNNFLIENFEGSNIIKNNVICKLDSINNIIQFDKDNVVRQ